MFPSLTLPPSLVAINKVVDQTPTTASQMKYTLRLKFVPGTRQNYSFQMQSESESSLASDKTKKTKMTSTHSFSQVVLGESKQGIKVKNQLLPLKINFQREYRD